MQKPNPSYPAIRKLAGKIDGNPAMKRATKAALKAAKGNKAP